MSFTAKYRGQCTEGDAIEPGDEVMYAGDRELIHVVCNDFGDGVHRPSRPVAICDRCWMQKPCDCEDDT